MTEFLGPLGVEEEFVLLDPSTSAAALAARIWWLAAWRRRATPGGLCTNTSGAGGAPPPHYLLARGSGSMASGADALSALPAMRCSGQCPYPSSYASSTSSWATAPRCD